MPGRLPYQVDETVDSTRQQAREARAEAPWTRARLTCVYPPEMHAAVELGPDRVVLGRAPEDGTSPALQHPTVSRGHLEVQWHAGLGQHLARDLGSRNGSAIDGVTARGGWHVLAPGAIVRVGEVIFVYEAGHIAEVQDAPEVSRRAVPGDAMTIRKLRHQLSRAAPDLSPVLVIGETGTGKEQIAQEIHRLSGRRGDFVPVNCATLGEQLIESQLFGHVKGAFTGATSDQQGLFRAAEGGTLFLDEIGEMPKELQPKLLRAIQEREVRAVGATKSDRVDVRIVAATHQDLSRRAREGSFRQDLYARLALWEVHVPPIRQRRADILGWTQQLYEIWAKERKLPARTLQFHAEAAELLLRSPWSENLRGLNRFVHELATRRADSVIRKENLPAWIAGPEDNA